MAAFIILFFAYAMNGIYPGSDKGIFIYDMGAQYASFFSYLYHIGEGYNSIFFQSLSGLGNGYFGTWAYYTSSPLSFFVLLFDPLYLQEALYFLTLFKISLSAVSFSIYMKNGRFKNLSLVPSLAASVSYSLMTYNLMYSMSLMWIDGVIMLPIVILGLELIIEGKSRVLFCISLALAIIFNYYTAYMIIIFIAVYFICISISLEFGIKKFFSEAFNIIISGLISVLMSAFLWLPVVFDLAEGRLDENVSLYPAQFRNPFGVIRGLFPLSYGGFLPDSNPPLFCGLIVTVSLFAFFISRRILIKQKIAALLVIVFFVISFCFSSLDAFWHGMQMPVSFPARYSFLLSFFLILVFSETLDKYYLDLKKLKNINVLRLCVICALFIDLGFNSYYVINSLDKDPVTCGYINKARYEHYFGIYDDLKEHYLKRDSKVVSDIDCSSDDGLMFGVSSLDYFSSSYDRGLSAFYRSLGLNTMRHNFEDLGLNPVSASLLGVDHYIPFMSGQSEYEYRYDLRDYFSPKVLYNGSVVYENNYSLPFASAVDENDSYKFDYNVFENLNNYCRDLSGVGNVFVEVMQDITSEELIGEGFLLKRSFTIRPDAGKHLYFYVSPADYEADDGYCYDYLFLNDSLVASYENNGYRYIVDLGVSDGSELSFSFVSASENSAVWFYSLDGEAYCEAMDHISDINVSDTSFEKSGIESDLSLKFGSDILILLPYEKGFEILVDGSRTEYSAYRDSLIKIHVDEGDHHIFIKYFPPGLKVGLSISFITISCFAIFCLFLSKRRINIKKITNDNYNFENLSIKIQA